MDIAISLPISNMLSVSILFKIPQNNEHGIHTHCQSRENLTFALLGIPLTKSA